MAYFGGLLRSALNRRRETSSVHGDAEDGTLYT